MNGDLQGCGFITGQNLEVEGDLLAALKDLFV